MNELKQIVVDAAVEWKRTFGFEGNQAALTKLSQATDNLISATPTIQECIDRSWVDCPKCEARRPVSFKGDVEPCEQCGDSIPWNLFVTTH